MRLVTHSATNKHSGSLCALLNFNKVELQKKATAVMKCNRATITHSTRVNLLQMCHTHTSPPTGTNNTFNGLYNVFLPWHSKQSCCAACFDIRGKLVFSVFPKDIQHMTGESQESNQWADPMISGRQLYNTSWATAASIYCTVDDEARTEPTGISMQKTVRRFCRILITW